MILFPPRLLPRSRQMPLTRSLLLTLIMLLPAASHAAPNIIVSIQPLHSLVAAITAGVTDPTLLIPATQSPHGFRLRPSNAQALHRADLVLWVGEALETTLASTIDGLGGDITVISALDLPGMALLPARPGGLHSDHADAEHPDHPKGKRPSTPQHGHIDPHLWLNPMNMLVLVDSVTAYLSKQDPDHATQYRHNAEQTRQRLQALDHDLQQRLGSIRAKPFLVLHDAFQYLEQHYRLNSIGSIAVSPDRRPGARRLASLRRRLRDSDTICVFAEPQVSTRMVDNLTSDSNTRSGTLDPIGAGIPPGPEAYFQMLQANADALLECLR